MVRVGASKLEIYPLVLGANPFGWTSDSATSHAVLDAFVEGGGNLIDTADSYSSWVEGNSGGESETIIGEWMKSRKNRDRVLVGTKVSGHPDFKGLAPDNIAKAAEASLRRLQTDFIDLYWAHYDDPETPLVDTLAAFQKLIDAGKVRYLGLSNYSPARMKEWLDVARQNGFSPPVALQPHYNLVHRQPYEGEIAPIAAANDLAVFPYYALASGFLTGKYRTQDDLKGAARGGSAASYLNDDGLRVIRALEEVSQAHGASITSTALAWLLAKPTITASLASVSKPSQLGDLLASTKLKLSPEEISRLDEASKPFGGK